MSDQQWGPDHPHYDWTIEDFCPDDIEPKPRLDHWPQLATWSIREAIALSHGLEPEVVFLYLLPHSHHPFVRRFQAKVGLAERAVADGSLKSPVRPSEFIGWAKKNGIEVSPSIVESVQATQRIAQASADGATPLNPKVRQSLLKMVLGLAVAHHHYNPDRSSAPKTIQATLDDFGLSLDDETIRKRLREASEEFDFDFTTKRARMNR